MNAGDQVLSTSIGLNSQDEKETIVTNKLGGMRAYLSGPMEYVADGGSGWRDRITPILESMGTHVLDPCKQSQGISELERVALIKRYRMEHNWEAIRELAKPMRNFDLRMVDIADFLVIYINPKVQMCGTWEEIFLANREKKPMLVVWEGGKEAVSSWFFGVIHHSNIFSNFDELIERIELINSGKYPMDDRWILFKGLHDGHGK